jgi:hypothetical protein
MTVVWSLEGHSAQVRWYRLALFWVDSLLNWLPVRTLGGGRVNHLSDLVFYCRIIGLG